MVLPLKFLLGGLAGGALIATPILATQLPQSSLGTTSSTPTQTEDRKPDPSNPKYQYKDSSGKKIDCHGHRTYGLMVNGKTVVWASSKKSVEDTNKNQYNNKGTIFEGDNSSCELLEPKNP